MNLHENTQCDVCMRDRFEGGRYKCLRCHDYDLCAICFDANASCGNHLPSHPMQIICSVSDMALYYGGEAFDGQNNVSLTCSHCGQPGFTESTLMTHLISFHTTGAESATPVLCPLCVRRPAASSNYMTSNLPGHLTIEHQVPGPRSIISSLNELAINALRNPPRSARNTSRIGSSHRSQMDAFFLELMAHLPDARLAATMRDRPEDVLELQHFQSQMRQERQQARQQSDYQRLSRRAYGVQQLTPEEQILLVEGPPPILPRQSLSRVSFARNSNRQSNTLLGPTERSASGYGRGHPLVRMPAMDRLENVAAAIESNRVEVPSGSGCSGRSGKTAKTNVEVNKNPTDDDSFLLRTLLNPVISEIEAAAIDRERADRSLFAQSLLLSAMSSDSGFENQEVAGLSRPVPENNKPKKKNKRRRKSAKKQAAATGDGNMSQVSSQFSQEDFLHDES